VFLFFVAALDRLALGKSTIPTGEGVEEIVPARRVAALITARSVTFISTWQWQGGNPGLHRRGGRRYGYRGGNWSWEEHRRTILCQHPAIDHGRVGANDVHSHTRLEFQQSYVTESPDVYRGSTKLRRRWTSVRCEAGPSHAGIVAEQVSFRVRHQQMRSGPGGGRPIWWSCSSIRASMTSWSKADPHEGRTASSTAHLQLAEARPVPHRSMLHRAASDVVCRTLRGPRCGTVPLSPRSNGSL